MSIAYNIEMVRDEIRSAALRVGRDPEEVCLVAVSKGFPVGYIREALRLGIRDIGENYAQELRAKHLELEKDFGGKINWHFIGLLQANKVKYIVGRVKLIHSLESLRVAAEIEKRSKRLGVITSVLIEVNLTGAGGGIREEELGDFLQCLASMEGIAIEGLMGMAPPVENPEEARSYFRRLRELRDRYRLRYPGLKELSMGMSGDYVVAIEEGATYVRIGRAIFGPRC